MPVDGDSATTWRAVCGAIARPGEVERVNALTGNPCPTCLVLAALASDVPPLARSELESASDREFPSAFPAAVRTAGSMLRYAPSWRERVVHWAKPDAPTKPYGSGTVVPGLCGEIGWGPDERPPGGWPMCAACTEIACEEDSWAWPG
ncbi:DUF3039 domain-containing protein [Saccharopolyspora rosea]|uniref:DUF3039 domain-containing protein n=1 Tax=Saccharopolyspora rosea TaxID=524884 RepID=A0ABW3FT62_9PSEU